MVTENWHPRIWSGAQFLIIQQLTCTGQVKHRHEIQIALNTVTFPYQELKSKVSILFNYIILRLQNTN